MNHNNNQTQFEFIVDEFHYFAPLSVIALSNTLKKIANNNKPLLYQFEKLRDPLRQFKLFIDLINGLSIDITDKNAFFLGYIGDELEISQLSQATDSYRQVKLTLDNIFDILHQLGILNISYPPAVEFAASNWPLISKRKETIHLPFSILDEIFSKNPNIQLDYNFVFEAIHDNSLNENQMRESEYISLFKYCDFSTFTQFQINQMIEFAFYDSPQISVLQKIIPTLLLGNSIKNTIKNPPTNTNTTTTTTATNKTQQPIQKKNEQKNVTTKPQENLVPKTIAASKPSNNGNPAAFDNITKSSTGVRGSRKGRPSPILPERSQYVDVEYEPGFELNGIFTMLQNQKSRFKDEVVVKIHERTKTYLKYTIFDYSNDKYWDNYDGSSCKIETAWIVVGFPNYSLRLKYYTLIPKLTQKNFRPPKSWKIYGSNDGNNFNENDLIDYVKEASDMNVYGKTNTFGVKGKAKPYSYFKFVMLENYSTKKIDSGDFNISALEFFGILTCLR